MCRSLPICYRETHELGLLLPLECGCSTFSGEPLLLALCVCERSCDAAGGTEALVGMLEGAIAAKRRGEICRSTEGGSVVAGAATAVDMVG